MPRFIIRELRRRSASVGSAAPVFWPVVMVRALFAGNLVLIFVPLALHKTLDGAEWAPILWPLSCIGSALFLSLLLVVFENLCRKLAHSETSVAHRSETYSEIIESYFVQWKLTRSERTVALYVMKGFSNSEIAALRQTSEATTKSQLNAIYRKAGVTSRQQLACFIFEDFVQLRPDTGADVAEDLASIATPRLAPVDAAARRG